MAKLPPRIFGNRNVHTSGFIFYAQEEDSSATTGTLTMGNNSSYSDVSTVLTRGDPTGRRHPLSIHLGAKKHKRMLFWRHPHGLIVQIDAGKIVQRRKLGKMVFQAKTIKHWLVFLRISSVLTQATACPDSFASLISQRI